MKVCWLCPNQLEGDERTGEHVIPSAIGGRREVFNFICRTCNGERGETWEAELAKQFLWFSSAAGVKRGRGGKHPDFKVQTSSGEKLKLRSDSILVPDGHHVSVEESNDKISISIQANDHKTIRNLLKKMVKTYPKFDLEKTTNRPERVDSYLDQSLSISFRYGGPAAGRSMVKSSLALLSEADVDKSICGRALTYLLDQDSDAPIPFCHFFDADLVVGRPKDHLFHCVSVIGQPQEGRILGYVEFFNFARILILISEEYSGVAFQETYAIDPVEGKTLDLFVDFSLVKERTENLLKMLSEPPRMYLEALQHTCNLVMDLNDNRVRTMALLKASAGASRALGLDPAEEDIPSELQDQWLQLFTQGLLPYIEARIGKQHTRSET